MVGEGIARIIKEGWMTDIIAVVPDRKLVYYGRVKACNDHCSGPV